MFRPYNVPLAFMAVWAGLHWALNIFSRVNLGQMKVSRPLRVAKLLIVFKKLKKN